MSRTRNIAFSAKDPDLRRMLRAIEERFREMDRRIPVFDLTAVNDTTLRPAAERQKSRRIFVRGTSNSAFISDGSAWVPVAGTSASFATPAITYGTTSAPGIASTTIRSDSRLPFPSTLLSAANATTLALTDDGTNQIFTGSSGMLSLRPSARTLSLARYTAGAEGSPTAGIVLSFNARSSQLGGAGTVTQGIQAIATADTGGETVAVLSGVQGRVAYGNNIVASAAVLYGMSAEVGTTSLTLGGPNTWTRIGALQVSPNVPTGTLAGTVTDAAAIWQSSNWPSIGTAGTYTNARACRLQLPTVGGTIRRGYELYTTTGNLGTEATDVEGFWCDTLQRGTTNRVSFKALGATTGTPTNVYGFRALGHTVGTNKWAFYADADPSTFSGITMTDATDIATSGTTGTKIGTATTQKLGFWNSAPVVQPATTGTILGFTAGGGAAVDDKGTFTGNTGATAYTISDIVNNLKTCGILKA